MQTALTNDFTCWGMFSVRECARAVLAVATKLEKIEALAPLQMLWWCLQWAEEQHMASLGIECDPESVVNNSNHL
jgi:hypothetical protein